MGRNYITSSDPFDTVDKPPIPKRLLLIQGHAGVADCVDIPFRMEQGPIIRRPLNLVFPTDWNTPHAEFAMNQVAPVRSPDNCSSDNAPGRRSRRRGYVLAERRAGEDLGDECGDDGEMSLRIASSAGQIEPGPLQG